MFLEPEEILKLTGYRRHADQRRWLEQHRWRFEVSATGAPVVSRAHAESNLNPGAASKTAWQPNVAAIRKAA